MRPRPVRLHHLAQRLRPQRPPRQHQRRPRARNHFDLAAKTIADIYKARWQIELFFKAIKQNLKIHAFIGNSRNAVMTQVWIALCAWLLVWFLKAISKTDWSLQRLMRVLQLNVFAKQDLLVLARGAPPPEPDTGQLGLGV